MTVGTAAGARLLLTSVLPRPERHAFGLPTSTRLPTPPIVSGADPPHVTHSLRRTRVVMLIAAQFLIGSVWIFHGLYSKLLRGIPRHRAIVARVLGERHADLATNAIGIAEICLGVWAWTGWQRMVCAAAQTLALISMNTLEIILAGDLLISAIGMLALNAGFLTVIWHWATSRR
jgi:DoxX-like family